MKLAVVAYPAFEETDRRWIESFRAAHDPQAPRLRAHVTLVFPLDASPAVLEPEVAAIAGSTSQIAMSIRRTEIVDDVVGGGTHVVLVPDEGAGEIAALHDRLYAGALRPYLRADIPYIPHITVGAARDSTSARELTKQLDAGAHVIRTAIDRIDVVDVGQPVVQSIAQFALSGRPG